MQKPLPPNDIRELTPPNLEYHYFEDWTEHRFQPVDQLTAVNTWWLAEASLLAYADESFIARMFDAAGLTQAGFRTAFVNRSSTQCFIAHGPAFVLVAFRGTEVKDFWAGLRDWMTNLQAALVPDGFGGRVHAGFQRGLQEVWSELCALLGPVLAQNPASSGVWLTGHSLGAALATLAADRALQQRAFPVRGLYTFGSPRVGDAAFARRVDTGALKSRAFRFVNHLDIVPSVPPPWGYRHTGRLCYFDETKQQLPDPRSGLWRAGRALRDLVLRPELPIDLALPLPIQVADHAPVYYAVHTWNQYERGLHGTLS
jgi:hypothetical protein